MDDEAVSPVIGVILMVAIAVVLAGVVFIVVGTLSDDESEQSPRMSGQRDEQEDRWLVVSGANVPQNQLSMYVDKADIRWNQGAPATLADSEPLGTTPQAMPGDEAWLAGDYIALCSTAGVQQDVELVIIHPDTNRILMTIHFADIAPCL